MAMNDDKSSTGVNRRGFLRSFGKGAVGTVSAATAVGMGLAPEAAEAAENKADRIKKRYRETDHVKAFYRTNRY
jgi:lipopolysaccharide export LptBFGC system permease protein LptF